MRAEPYWLDPLTHLRRQRPDHAVMYFSPMVLQRQAARFLQGFPGMVTYAVKANARPEVLVNLAAAGIEGFDVSCMQILAPGELDPELEIDTGIRGDIRLTDIETGRASEVTISPALIEQYRARLRRHIDGIAETCKARGMRHMLLDTGVPVDRVILDSLRRRRIVG